MVGVGGGWPWSRSERRTVGVGVGGEAGVGGVGASLGVASIVRSMVSVRGTGAGVMMEGAVAFGRKSQRPWLHMSCASFCMTPMESW